MCWKGLCPGSNPHLCPARPGFSSPRSQGTDGGVRTVSGVCMCVYTSGVCGVVGRGVFVCVRAPRPAQIPAAQPPRNAGGRPGQIPDLSFSICETPCPSGDLSCAETGSTCTCLSGPDRLPRRHHALREEPFRSLRGSPPLSPPGVGVTVSHGQQEPSSAHGASGGFAELAPQAA